MVQAQAQNIDPQRLENLGPAERILQTLTNYTDHLQHNRPGFVVPDARTNIGARWQWALWKVEGDEKVVYVRTEKPKGKIRGPRPPARVRVGLLGEDMKVRENGRVIGRFMDPGLYEEAIAWVYQQMAEIWEMDNELAAKFASWSWPKDHRDMKCILAAFMLVQNRCGEPHVEDGKVDFFDDDYRAVGEAMVLLRGEEDINPRMLLRIRDILKLDSVAEINRKMGFG